MKNNFMTGTQRFAVTMVDTKTDTIVDQRKSNEFFQIKKAILKLPEMPLKQKDNPYVLYISDKEFFTMEGMKRLDDMEKSDPLNYIDKARLYEVGGIDFDLWHDYYLTPFEREAFDNHGAFTQDTYADYKARMQCEEDD